MKIKKIESYHVRLPLVSPFKTSYGELKTRAVDILIITDENGTEGYGELLPFEQPDYLEETLVTAREIIRTHLLPLLVEKNLDHPDEVHTLLAPIRGNHMAKASLETAIWDLYAKRNGHNLSHYLKHTRTEFPVGISLGIEPDLTKLKETVRNAIELGYTRVKLKIQPGYDLKPVAFLREHFPDLLLMVDANSAYTRADIPTLKELDNYQVAMIEQPFATNDFLDHADLQKNTQTRICLDENIRSLKDVQLAHKIGSCRSINLKIARVGGLSESLKIIDYCQENDLIVWLGGMFESGVGRALNLQVASQKALSFPADLAASRRYFYRDIITEPLSLTQGLARPYSGLGLGITLDYQELEKVGTHRQYYP